MLLRVCIIAEDGEAIVEIGAKGTAVLTVRSGEREQIGAVTLTIVQAQALADVLGRIPEREDDDADDYTQRSSRS